MKNLSGFRWSMLIASFFLINSNSYSSSLIDNLRDARINFNKDINKTACLLDANNDGIIRETDSNESFKTHPNTCLQLGGAPGATPGVQKEFLKILFAKKRDNFGMKLINLIIETAHAQSDTLGSFTYNSPTSAGSDGTTNDAIGAITDAGVPVSTGNSYIPGQYMCGDFKRDAHAALEAAGFTGKHSTCTIKAVYLEYPCPGPNPSSPAVTSTCWELEGFTHGFNDIHYDSTIHINEDLDHNDYAPTEVFNRKIGVKTYSKTASLGGASLQSGGDNMTTSFIEPQTGSEVDIDANGDGVVEFTDNPYGEGSIAIENVGGGKFILYHTVEDC